MMSCRVPCVDRRADAGFALVLVLLFMLGVSAIGGSMIVLSQTESLASANYRMMSQARYGAESGVHAAINHLLNTYVAPGTAGDPLSNYDTTVSPVTYLGQPVVLSSMSAITANYPVAATRTAFAAASQGALAAGGASVRYSAAATLMSMRQVLSYGTGGATVVQTWRITGSGAIGGVHTATVEVSSVLEREIVPTHTYAAFATNAGCGALSFSGGVLTNSYDSQNMTMVAGVPAMQSTSGDVGTNGNLNEVGGSVVNGTLSTPRSGVGNCKAGAVDAATIVGGSQIAGGILQLPQAVTYPPPAHANPLPPTSTMSMVSTSTCAGAGLPSPCSGAGGILTLTPASGTPMSLGNLRLSGGSTLHLAAGTYNVNSITLVGGSSLIIDSGPVIMNVEGAGQATVLDFTGGTVSNGTFIPSNFQIQYAAAGSMNLNGGTSSAAMVYAPAASLSLSGGANFYGSLLGATVTVTGGTRIHYDRQLSQTYFTVGNYMLNAFSWKKY